MAGIKTLDGYTLEDIVKAVVAVLQPEEMEENPVLELPEEYVPKNTVKRYKDIDDYPDLMKVKDVQEYLRIGENKTYDFLNHPKCPTFRVGASILIRKEKLLQFMDSWENGLEGVAHVDTN